MKKWALGALGSGCALLGVLVLLYFSGWWIPNYPSRSVYPFRGIDVSRHQGHIDWKMVSSSGISFAYLKATEGGDFQDARFKENLQAAHEAGLACGAYHFFSLKTSGRLQAQNFIKNVPAAEMALPPAVDLEFWGNSSDRPSPESFQAELLDYIREIRIAYGREPVIYTSGDFSSVYLNDFQIQRFWVRDVLLSPNLDGTKAWQFWQFSEKGRVPGIEGFVDLDVYNGPADHFDAPSRGITTP
jgi:lysozyme